MKKKFSAIIVASFFCGQAFAQVLFSGSLGNLSLTSYTSGNVVSQYTSVPGEFTLINDNNGNNTGSLNNPNVPFHVPEYKYAGWAVAYNSIVNDTFLVSSSWLDNTSVASDEWIIMPTVNISANTVLTWLAMSPDPAYPDGYEVYGTSKQGSLISSDFTIGDRLFQLDDGNTSGGGEKNIWTRRSVYLGDFSGQTLRFAFRNNSTNMYQLWLDDIEIKNTSLGTDVAAASIEAEKYILLNSAQTITFNIVNTGAVNVNSITVNYTFGNSSVASQTFGFTNGLSHLQNSALKFSLPYSVTSPGYYEIKCWISNVNGTQDQNLQNDTSRFYVSAMSSSPEKNILMEQFVSANNGESPDTQEKALAFQSSRVIVVNVHASDSLEETNSSGIINDYLKNFATAMTDRVYYNDLLTNTMERTYYQARVTDRLNAVTPASVNIINKTFNTLSNELSFTVKADFTGEVKGDYRLNAYLVENNVYGNVYDTTVNGFNQLSHFYNVPWSPYYQKGYFSLAQNAWVLDAYKFKHHNVLVHSFSGSYGSAGVIPVNGGTAGQSFQQTFSLTVPAMVNGVNRFNPDNMYLVAFVAEYNADKYKRNVLNAVREKLTENSEVVGTDETTLQENWMIYPNPNNGVFYISKPELSENCRLNIYDLHGKCVWEKSITANEGADVSSLSNGIYILELISGREVQRKKLLIQK